VSGLLLGRLALGLAAGVGAVLGGRADLHAGREHLAKLRLGVLGEGAEAGGLHEDHEVVARHVALRLDLASLAGLASGNVRDRDGGGGGGVDNESLHVV
jgi:hypothetical protein